jgi:hypothetical protein
MKLTVFLLLVSASAVLGQQLPTPLACPATEKAILDLYQVQHQAVYKRDFATFARIIDDQAILNYDDGKRRSKDETVASSKQEQSGWEEVDDGPMEDTVVKFEDGVAILTFAQGFRMHDLNADFTITASYRQSYIFGCRAGEWKVIFRAQIPIPTFTEPPIFRSCPTWTTTSGIIAFTRMGRRGTSASSARGTNSLRARALTKRTNSFPEGLTPFLSAMTVRSNGSCETKTAKLPESTMSLGIRTWKQDAWATDLPASACRVPARAATLSSELL